MFLHFLHLVSLFFFSLRAAAAAAAAAGAAASCISLWESGGDISLSGRSQKKETHRDRALAQIQLIVDLVPVGIFFLFAAPFSSDSPLLGVCSRAGLGFPASASASAPRLSIAGGGGGRSRRSW